jgi:hypothetical protein
VFSLTFFKAKAGIDVRVVGQGTGQALDTAGSLDEALQDVIATAGAAMTPEGRHSLADWTPYRRSGNEKSR